MKEVLGQTAKYDLIANVMHTGKADSGNYRVQALHAPSLSLKEMFEMFI